MTYRRIVIFCLMFAGCGGNVTRKPVPAELRNVARVPGLPDGIRAWGDQFSPTFQKSIADTGPQALAAYGDNQPHVLLALSGGGSNGAFCAGLLCGWTDHGDRPVFRVVTGISAGAVVAPFAFLGKDYDGELAKIATGVSDEKVFNTKGIFSILGSDSLTDTDPLVKYLSGFYDEKLLRAIAAENAKGRRLFVVTTDLDAQRPVLWDMTAIAAAGGPTALQTFRKVILASSALPVLFPPVYLDVTANGKKYDEMHVDGGVSTQVVLYGNVLHVPELIRQHAQEQHTPMPQPIVYVVRNGKLSPEPADVGPKLADIAGRSVNMLTKSQGVGDLYVVYDICKRDGLDFRMTAIPDDAATPTGNGFDPKTIQSLFDRGRRIGRDGIQWATEPPDFRPSQRSDGQLP